MFKVHIPSETPKRKKGKEGDYTTQLIKGFDRAGGEAIKIADPTPGVGAYKTNKRPYDCRASLDGKSIAFECKWKHEPEAFGLRHFDDHQIKSLNKHMDAGSRSYAVLFVKYGHRVHMLVWNWKWFRGLTKSIGKHEIIRLLDSGQSYLAVDGAFPIGAFLDPPHQHLYGLSQ